MADRESNGAGGGNWSVGASWVGGVAPVSGADNIIIVAGDTITGNADFTFGVGKMLVVDATGILNIDATHALTFVSNNTVNVAGTLDFATDATFDGNWNGAGAISVDGNVVFTAGMSWSLSGTFTCDGAAGVHTITTNGVTGPKMVVDNVGTASLTAQDAATYPSFTLTAGVYTDGDFDHDIGGDIIIGAASTLVSTGHWTQTTSGNVTNATYGNRFGKIILGSSGVTSTLTNTVYCRQFAYGAGIVTGAHTIYIYPLADNFWVSGSGSLSVSTIIIKLDATRTNGTIGPLTISDYMRIWTGGDFNLTMTGDFDIGGGTLEIWASIDNKTCGLIVGMNTFIAGDITIGRIGHPLKLGSLDFGSGTCNIASLQAGDAAQDGNAVDFGSAYITLSGTILGEQNVGKKIDFAHVNAEVHGGTITKCDLSGTNTLYPYECTDGLGNTNVIFGSAPPGGLMMVGAGR